MCISATASSSGFNLAGQASPDGGEGDRCEPSLRLAAVAKGLAHPTRVTILRLIATSGDRLTTGEIVGELSLAQSTVSEHLRVLREAGLVVAHRDGPRICYTAERSVIRRFARSLYELAPDLERLHNQES